jgi:hypothetical protein
MKKTVTKAVLRKATEERLRRVARAGEVFIDGDAFKAIVLDPTLVRGDDYRVDHDKFIGVKQTLFKLKRLEPGDIGVMTWRKFGEGAAIVVPVDSDPNRPSNPGSADRNSAMAAAFAGKTAAQLLTFKGFPVLSVCAPIRDSLDDVVGVVEVFASLAPDKVRANYINY